MMQALSYISQNPFHDEVHLPHSNAYNFKDDVLDSLSGKKVSLRDHIISNELIDFINSNHPCLGAHSVFNLNNYRLGVYSELSGNSSTLGLSHDLMDYIMDCPPASKTLYSFLAVFPETPSLTERQFEKNLWDQLCKLSELDHKYHKWDDSVSSDPDNPQFSFSFGSKGFYVIGMHPGSSRKARQFAYPMIIFNYHEQFERLRESGVYSKMKEKNRSRDTQYSGSVNPMLEDFGKASEARQYSGRQVDDKWKCPFLNEK